MLFFVKIVKMTYYENKIMVFMTCALFFGTASNAQTALEAGGIGGLWNQVDTPDDFAFVTYVDLAQQEQTLL